MWLFNVDWSFELQSDVGIWKVCNQDLPRPVSLMACVYRAGQLLTVSRWKSIASFDLSTPLT